ncbi:AraC family transcriptional regulator [Neobacillus dielmonensis]|uniref:AraC family transcriptional regulator n=1 Tax=Neobacillus dielmonensis TaxID=1347369 RepID=UPI0005A87B3B|nr:helix-turn-helix domain-containing protein [Neobacillus dielmonensis]
MEIYKKKDGFESEKLFVLPDYILMDLVKNPLVSPLYITDIGYFPRAKYHYRERPEGIDTYILIYCSDGEGWVDINHTKHFTLKSNTLIVIPEGTPHRYGADEEKPWSIYWFHLKGSQVKELLECFGFESGPIQLPISGFVKFIELFNHCFDTLSEKPFSLNHHIHVSQSIKYLLSSIGLLFTKQNNNDRNFENVINYMNDQMDRSMNLQELAKYTGLSKPHLIHLFKDETGYTPIDYFLRMKINRSCQMLDLTELTVKQIALSVGIKDPYYFSRIFKKVIGYSPTEYRSIKKG